MLANAGARTRARELIDRVDGAPRDTLERAIAELDDLTPGGDQHAASMFARVQGTSLRLLGDLSGARTALESAVEYARAAAAYVLEGEALMSLGVVDAYTGDTDAALARFDVAESLLDGVEAARVVFQRSSILYRRGDHTAALALMNRALPQLEAAADLRHVAHTLSNRGVVLAYGGQLRSAEADLERADEMYRSMRLYSAAAVATHNLGWVAVRDGNLVRGLQLFHQAAEELQAIDRPHWELAIDRCEALLIAACPHEAQSIADHAAVQLSKDGNVLEAAEAHLMAAYVHVWCGDGHRGEAAATRASELCAAHGRPLWAAAAEALMLRSRALGGTLSTCDGQRLVEVAEQLRDGNHEAAAREALLTAGRIALANQELGHARELLSSIGAARSSGPVNVRLQAWLALALLRLAEGNRSGASRAATAGADLVARSQAAFGSLDARAAITSHASELFEIGLHLATGSEDPKRVLAWIERTRAGAIRQPPVMPPDDAELANTMRELRITAEQARSLESSGTSSRDLRRRQRQLENRVVARSRRLPGVGQTRSRYGVDEICSALENQSLVAFANDGIRRVAVMGDASGLRLVPAGQTRAETDLLAQLRRRLRRLAARVESAPTPRIQAAIDDAVDELDESILGPLDIDGPLVIIPSDDLRGVPWGLLARRRHTSISVAPSASVWFEAQQRAEASRTTTNVLIASGPNVDPDNAEFDSIADLYDGPTLLAGEDATCSAVLDALNGADIAHLIAHGSTAAENALLTNLLLADGPLYAHEFQRLTKPPRLVVLSSCEVGQEVVPTPGEVMGMASIFLAAGARTVIASTAQLPDSAATAELLTQLHHRYLSGQPIGEALIALDATSPLLAMECFGAT